MTALGTTQTLAVLDSIQEDQKARALHDILEGAIFLGRAQSYHALVSRGPGQPVKLSRPLDWLVVSDHSDGIGIIAEIRAKNPELMADPVTARWGEMMAKGGAEAQAATVELVAAQSQGKLPKPWVIDVASGSFRRGTSSAFGFVAKPAFNAT